jgi:hypothetical protein
MLKFIVLIVAVLLLAGCISISTSMTCFDCGDVSCTSSAAKPIEVFGTVAAQVPTGGSTMNSATQNLDTVKQSTYSTAVKK